MSKWTKVASELTMTPPFLQFDSDCSSMLFGVWGFSEEYDGSVLVQEAWSQIEEKTPIETYPRINQSQNYVDHHWAVPENTEEVRGIFRWRYKTKKMSC